MSKAEPRSLTLILALSTFALAIATVWLAWESREGSYRQVGVESWLSLEQRWDSPEMQKARDELTAAIQAHHDSSEKKDLPTDVLDFFESVGSVYQEGLINRKLAEMSFSYEAVGWWEATKGYVFELRRRADDKTTYDRFEQFAKAMRTKYGDVEVAQFLKEQEDP